MVQLFESGAYLIDGKELIADNADAAVQVAAKDRPYNFKRGSGKADDGI